VPTRPKSTTSAPISGRLTLRIDGDAVETGETFTVTNPGDTDQVLGEFAAGDETHVDEAVAAASDAFDEWKETSWGGARRDISRRRGRHPGPQTRDHSVDGLRKCKTRNEAIAEVDEAIDFLRYYSSELERNEGYTADTHEPTPGQRCVSDLQPYGVFGVVAPFNFPFAITVGMTTGALITGNTAVVKPASTTPLTAHAFYDALAEAGIPDGVVNLVTGGGRAVGQPMIEHEDVAGFVFTGSRGRTRDPADLRRAGQTRASRRGARREEPGHRLRQRRCLEGRLWREVWCVFVQRSEVLCDLPRIRPRGHRRRVHGATRRGDERPLHRQAREPGDGRLSPDRRQRDRALRRYL